MKYFGTDGIRLKDTKKLIFLAKRIAYALSKKNASSIVLGKDTRKSGKKICKALLGELKKYGVDTYYLNTIPSAAVAYYTKKLGFDYGIVITASHNPKDVNGIKLFNSLGEKLSKKEEIEIEKLIDFKEPEKIKKALKKQINLKEKKYCCGKVKKLSHKDYIDLLVNNAPNLSGNKIVLDCANGASKKLAPKIFKALKASVIAINTGSGNKINTNCGAVFPEQLKSAVIKSSADIGFAFDGDADRCVCVLKTGEILSGDNILYALSKHLKVKNVVGTIYANGSLDKILKSNNITLHRSKVGDQEVKKLMNTKKCCFGGERSGHFIFSNILPTGDGIITALQILKVKNFDTLCKFKKAPSKTINLNSKNKKTDLKKLEAAKKEILELLGDDGRIIIRASGTEDLIRVLIEHKSDAVIKKVVTKVMCAYEKE